MVSKAEAARGFEQKVNPLKITIPEAVTPEELDMMKLVSSAFADYGLNSPKIESIDNDTKHSPKIIKLKPYAIKHQDLVVFSSLVKTGLEISGILSQNGVGDDVAKGILDIHIQSHLGSYVSMMGARSQAIEEYEFASKNGKKSTKSRNISIDLRLIDEAESKGLLSQERLDKVHLNKRVISSIREGKNVSEISVVRIAGIIDQSIEDLVLDEDKGTKLSEGITIYCENN